MGSHNNQEWNRKETKQELKVALVRAAVRLSRHIDAVFAGEYAAIDDVAALLRTLCGDGLIKRAIKRLELSDPVLYISRAPEVNAGTHLTVGNFPVFNEVDDYRETTLLGWLACKAAVFTENGKRQGKSHTSQRNMTWSQLVAGVSNVYGSHAAEWIPPWMEETQMVGVHTQTLSGYMLEYAATTVEACLSSLLEELDEAEHAHEFRQLPVRPVNVHWMRVRLEENDVIQVEFLGGSHAGTPDGFFPLTRVVRNGRVFGSDLRRSNGIDLITDAPEAISRIRP